MLLRLVGNKGQNTAEYAIVIALIIGAAIAMQTYVKRGLQGRSKDATDFMAQQTPEIGATQQYEPYYLTQTTDAQRAASSTKDTSTGGGVDTSATSTAASTGFTEYEDTSGQD